jgi:predicted transcriptional regulator
MDILLIIKEESRKGQIILTRVQQKSNVPFDRLKIYLSELKDLGLVQEESILKLTEKGLQYAVEYAKVFDFMERMGLTYD